MNPVLVVEPIPATCTVDDVCRILSISRSEFYEKRQWLQSLGILVPQVPQLGRRPKYLGAYLAKFLNVKGQEEQLRAVIRRVK